MNVPFSSFIPMETELYDELNDAFHRVLKRSWYVEGIEGKRFENQFAEYIGTQYCVGVGNGLDALTISLLSLGIGP